MNGYTCKTDNECYSGHCTAAAGLGNSTTICCDQACNGPCQICGTSGSCGLQAQGYQDPKCLYQSTWATCVTNGECACDAVGHCTFTNGYGCTGNSQCASGNCQGGQCL
jgi:hypothetical protein